MYMYDYCEAEHIELLRVNKKGKSIHIADFFIAPREVQRLCKILNENDSHVYPELRKNNGNYRN